MINETSTILYRILTSLRTMSMMFWSASPFAENTMRDTA